MVLNVHVAAAISFNNRMSNTLSNTYFFLTEIQANAEHPKEALVDDPDEMFQLADLLEGVSVDCAELSLETHSPAGINNLTDLQRIVFIFFSSFFSHLCQN